MSRPRINPEMRRKNLAITLSPKLILRAKAFAELGKVSVSEMVEVTLTEFINKTERELKRIYKIP